MKLRFAPAETADHRFWRVAARVLLPLVCIVGLGACADKEAPTDNTAMLPDNEQVSTVPWNKPQGWENQGALGALANDPRINGGTQQ